MFGIHCGENTEYPIKWRAGQGTCAMIKECCQHSIDHEVVHLEETNREEGIILYAMCGLQHHIVVLKRFALVHPAGSR